MRSRRVYVCVRVIVERRRDGQRTARDHGEVFKVFIYVKDEVILGLRQHRRPTPGTLPTLCPGNSPPIRRALIRRRMRELIDRM